MSMYICQNFLKTRNTYIPKSFNKLLKYSKNVPQIIEK